MPTAADHLDHSNGKDQKDNDGSSNGGEGYFFASSDPALPFSSNSNDGRRNGDSRGTSFVFVDNRALVSKGMLCFHLLRLRELLNDAYSAFAPSGFFSRIKSNLLVLVRPFLGEQLGPEFRHLHVASSAISTPVRIVHRLIFGEVMQNLVTEYNSILEDLVKLDSPDQEVSGSRKIAIAERMRTSYKFFKL